MKVYYRLDTRIRRNGEVAIYIVRKKEGFFGHWFRIFESYNKLQALDKIRRSKNATKHHHQLEVVKVTKEHF